MARKRSYHLQPRRWNETSLAQLQRWISNSFVKLALQSKKRSCSVATQLSLYSNLKVSVYLKLKYTRVFKHKPIHKCITHSKVSRNIMAADAATFHNYGHYYITHGMQYARSRWCTAYCTPLQQFRFWIHLMTVSMLNTALFRYLKR